MRQADPALCEIHAEKLHGIAAALSIRLPVLGGDKPARICGALFPRAQIVPQ